jgi:hypothetical protein
MTMGIMWLYLGWVMQAYTDLPLTAKRVKPKTAILHEASSTRAASKRLPGIAGAASCMNAVAAE